MSIVLEAMGFAGIVPNLWCETMPVAGERATFRCPWCGSEHEISFEEIRSRQITCRGCEAEFALVEGSEMPEEGVLLITVYLSLVREGKG